MTCTSDRLLDNVKWRLEALAVHADTDSTLKGFVYYDRDKLNGEVTSGMTRGFTLELTDGEAQEDQQGCLTQAVQQWGLSLLVRVAYYKHPDWMALQKLIQRDRFDIVKLLRNQTNWDGVPENASLKIGADARRCLRWRIVEVGHALYLELHWSVDIIEDE